MGFEKVPTEGPAAAVRPSAFYGGDFGQVRRIRAHDTHWAGAAKPGTSGWATPT